MTSSDKRDCHSLPLKSKNFFPLVFFFMAIRHLSRDCTPAKQALTLSPTQTATKQSTNHATCHAHGRRQCVLPWNSVQRHHPETSYHSSFSLSGDDLLPGLRHLHLWMFCLNKRSCDNSTLNEKRCTGEKWIFSQTETLTSKKLEEVSARRLP